MYLIMLRMRGGFGLLAQHRNSDTLVSFDSELDAQIACAPINNRNHGTLALYERPGATFIIEQAEPVVFNIKVNHEQRT